MSESVPVGPAGRRAGPDTAAEAPAAVGHGPVPDRVNLARHTFTCDPVRAVTLSRHTFACVPFTRSRRGLTVYPPSSPRPPPRSALSAHPHALRATEGDSVGMWVRCYCKDALKNCGCAATVRTFCKDVDAQSFGCAVTDKDALPAHPYPLRAPSVR
jgi:hypothetical protein